MYLTPLLTRVVARLKQIRDQPLVQNVLHLRLVQRLPGFPGLGSIPHRHLFVALAVPDMDPFRLAVNSVAIGGDNTDRVVGSVGRHVPICLYEKGRGE